MGWGSAERRSGFDGHDGSPRPADSLVHVDSFVNAGDADPNILSESRHLYKLSDIDQ